MAWGRGFFRLWVLLSALWVALSLAVFWPRLTSAPSLGQLYFTMEPGAAEPVAYQMGSDGHKSLLARESQGALKFIPIGNGNFAYVAADLDLGERADQLIKIQDAVHGIRARDAAREFRGIVGQMMKMAAFAPITLLILGGVVGWVLSGFRKQDMTAH